MRSTLIAGISFGAFLAHGPVAPADTRLAFEQDVLCSMIVNALETPLWYDTTPDHIRRNNSRILFGFVFQYWMVATQAGKGDAPGAARFDRIIKEVREYIDLDDPLRIAASYGPDGKLTPLGRQMLGLEPLGNAEDVFENKDDYRRAVDAFLRWLRRAID